jgi:hypothetical protein
LEDDSRPFLALEYEGTDFPSEYEKSELGYEPDAVFLTDSIEQDPEANGVSVRGEDLDSFYGELLSDFSLVFRYVNEEAVEDMMENYREDEERDVHTTAPPYTFDAEDAGLDPNLAWMDRIEEVSEPLQMFGIEAIGLESNGEFHEDTDALEEILQRSGVYFKPDVQGVARVFYDWSSDQAEIITYSDTVVMRDGAVDGNSNWQTFDYDVDTEEVGNLERALNTVVSSVGVDTFPQTVIPPEIKDRV